MPGYIKLLFFVVIVLLLVKFHQSFVDYLISSSNVTKKIMTKYEIDDLAHQMFLDFNSNNMPFPSYSEFEWRDYIRKKKENKKLNRDPSIDLWGTPYQIRPSSSVAISLPKGLMIRSAGEDKIFYNDDDIYTVCQDNNSR